MPLDRVLIVDDEENMRHLLSVILNKEGYDIDQAGDGREAMERLNRKQFDFILTDVRMPKMNGFDLLEQIKLQNLEALCIVMSAYGNVELALEAMKKGAYDYISKPFKPDEVILTLRKAAERQKLFRENRILRSQAQKQFEVDSVVAKSSGMQSIFKAIDKVAEFKSTVLITGESGTGKEMIARMIHMRSPRKNKTFVAINCGALPENLLESELFGHVRGAFTGASHDKKGLFEEAHEGTIFLDEIGELPLPLQVKLLRVLQEEEIRRVGDVKSTKINARVIAATIRDLESMAKVGSFREDLYYRLNVLPLRLPPLRERIEDVPPLIDHFLRQFNAKFDLHVKGLTKEAYEALLSYAWPGNVRELENTIERAIVLTEVDKIGLESLPNEVVTPAKTGDTAVDSNDLSIKKAVRAIERKLICRALGATKGNRTRAAKMLEISHRALLYKMKEYEIGEEET